LCVRIIIMKLDIRGFFEDIFNSFKSGSVLGIDIGTSSIKVTEISRKGTNLKLENYGILEAKDYLAHPNLALQTGSLSIIEEEATRMLKTLLRDMRVKTKTAVIAIPSFSSFVTVFDMPLLSSAETAQSINFQARQYVPIPISQVSIDWFKVEEYTNEKGHKFQRLLLIGIPNKVTSSFKAIMRSVGLRLVAMELDSVALVGAFPKFRTPTLIIDIGAESTNILVTEGGVLKQNGQTDYSGINITRAVSKSLDLGMLRAEDLKRRHGLLGQAGESELSALISPFLDVIIQEVEYVKELYERRYGRKVQQFVIVGGSGNLLGIEEHFSAQLGLKNVMPDIFAGIQYPGEIRPVMGNLRKEFSVSLGLTKKYFAS